MTEQSPISLPTYTLGDEGKSNHFNASTSRETAATEAKSLSVGDAAFILRTDGKWTYSIVTEKIDMKEPEDCIGCPYKDGPTLEFNLDVAGNRKVFPESVWGKYIRVIKVDKYEMAVLNVDAREKAATKERSKQEEKKIGCNIEDIGSIFTDLYNSLAEKASMPFKHEEEKKEEDDQQDRDAQEEARKLLQSRDNTLYKAETMQEDPAALALGATSFADAIVNSDVVVVECDPSAAALAEKLGNERVYGDSMQGINIVEMEEPDLKGRVQ